MIRLLRKHWLFLIILLFGIFLRSYRALDWFMYSHDQDLAGWIVKDILVNKHLRLIGQETTSKGVFVGPLFYYLQIPFYLLFNMDPAGVIFLPILISAFTIFSFYFIFTKIFNQKVGLIASFIYAASTLIVFTDREVVPTQPVMLWTAWFFYGLFLLLKGRKKAFILVGLLLGLAWNFNLALIILSPLLILAQILSKKKINFHYLIFGLLAFFITMVPFFVFEARHAFRQTKALVSSLTTSKDYVEGAGKGYGKFDRVMQLIYRNTTRLVWGADHKIPEHLTFFVVVFIFGYLVAKKLIRVDLAILMALWLGIYILFFSVNSINVSEYYFNGMNVVWIAILAVGISHLRFSSLALGLFLAINLYSFFTKPITLIGYSQRRALVAFISEDSQKHSYPCISISYITSPGFDLGYRYFFWRAGLHVNQPKSGSPPYTIVFPHSKVNRLDKTFGALGLVLPDYGRYTKEAVKVSCSGANSNLTDPLFGYTE